jgi:hypothetical protein
VVVIAAVEYGISAVLIALAVADVVV